VNVRLPSPANVALTSEDAAFAPDPTPPVIEQGAAGATIRFQRAGAVILTAGNVLGNP
jgi:hypothetical protein